jgi:hypothetical protein
VREEVLSRGGRYQPVADNLEVKEVRVGGGATWSAATRRRPERTRRPGRPWWRSSKPPGPGRGQGSDGQPGLCPLSEDGEGGASLDEAALAADARLDGKFVLTTNTDLPAAEVAQTYKSLWRVERTFREQKSTLEVRPLYHQRDDTCMGHIVASFLALRLEVDLQQRLEERGAEVSWPDLLRDLGQVQSVIVELDGQRYQLRTDLVGAAHQAFAAAGVRPPPTVTPWTRSRNPTP